MLVQLNERPAVGADCRATLNLRNPLPTILRQGKFFVEGGALTEPLELPAP